MKDMTAMTLGIFYVTPCAAKIAAVKSPVGEKRSPITGVINMDFLFSKVYRRIKQGNGDSCILPEVEVLDGTIGSMEPDKRRINTCKRKEPGR
jgi:hypothetical protein